jgi:hypothetical protein
LAPIGHIGIGKLAVADWWLGMALVVDDETAAAAPPAMTTDRAKMRMASFIVGNSMRFELPGDWSPGTAESYTIAVFKSIIFI